MNCPRCNAPLEPEDIRRLNAQLNHSMVRSRKGGTTPTCDCGGCRKCRERANQRRRRAAPGKEK